MGGVGEEPAFHFQSLSFPLKERIHRADDGPDLPEYAPWLDGAEIPGLTAADG
jgi:hypothetical protein